MLTTCSFAATGCGGNLLVTHCLEQQQCDFALRSSEMPCIELVVDGNAESVQRSFSAIAPRVPLGLPLLQRSLHDVQSRGRASPLQPEIRRDAYARDHDERLPDHVNRKPTR